MTNKDENTSVQKTNINWYPGHMAKTKRLIKENIHLIDIVYEIVDARIPYSSKIVDIDEYIKDKPKIMIFSKYDLCDINETKKWIKYYQNKGYTVIPLDNIHNPNVQAIINETEKIMDNNIKQRTDKGMNKRKIRALVVGIPNVGKSTLINRFAGRKALDVGNKPGVTKDLRWIRINDKIELLDSPGMLYPKFTSESVALNLASLTAIKEEILPLDKVVQYILDMLYKYYPDILESRYGISELSDSIYENIDIIGKKRGCLVRGGFVDEEKVYSIIMNDIKDGHIKNITFDRIDEINN